MNVPVYVSLQFKFGCLSFPLEQLTKKKVCFLLFIHNVQVSMNNNKQNMKKVTNSSGFLQKRRGLDCIAAQSDAFLYPARHVLLILTREFLITKHLINCLQSFSAALLSGDK